MKLYRIRFIVLGLLLRVFFVWCQTCGTKFTDPASSAYLAGAVVEGKVTKIMPPNEEGRYNVTLAIRKVRKGASLLPKGKKTKRLTIGEFGVENLSDCVTNITKSNKKYFFFIKKVTTEISTFYRISAFPVLASKQTGRLIRKAACKTCGKKPELKKIKARKVVAGKRLQLRCRLRSGKPDPVIKWTKNGVPISGKTKGVQIKNRKKYSQLRINKASNKDSGMYKCIATNVVGSTEKSVNIQVSPSKGTTTKKPTKPTTSGRYIPCNKRDAQDYCLNGGKCRIIKELDLKTCTCPEAFIGQRCQFPDPFAKKITTGNSPSPEQDRTLTIIGIVIGILIFVCFCIASYFLAKNRRMAYLKKRAAKKKHLNGTVKPYVVVDPPSNGRMLQRQNTVNMETQTEEGSLYPPYPNANPGWSNAYINLQDNDFLRNSPGNRNSRTRLSGVSTERERPTSQPETMTSPKPIYNRSPSDPTRPSLPAEHRGDIIPRLRVSEDSVGSDGEEDVDEITSLRISEDDERTPFVQKHLSESGRFSPDRNSLKNDDDTLSQRSSCVDDEELRRIYCADDNERYGRRCSETLSWNERGSPEQLDQQNCFNIEDPKYLKSNNCAYLENNQDSFVNIYSTDILEDKPSTPV
ncbi:pro-neuregulin-1, membrane-bound isoform-like isoform X1 [Saccostrea echinata]|uniref:pro-neuregulin-1, membrane-bound isoform-like isoform X1 n=1 Tax=Saccostrea echinata TaxID=191078 RepID=UPI002A804723|nr:pro-neuregulin-1, membrane-bound isoform-like isoform X1 [Saccostrea echinata]